MKFYCMYLRKSRADAEAEAHGAGETLARHERILTELAESYHLEIRKKYKEIVSGDSIAARPQMQAMLAAVQEGIYAGVLCMEVERLARGNTIDQGRIEEIFRQSGTRIITPQKIYHLENEADEEYLEFSLFMSRREYRTIRRRMQAGRLAAVKEGNYISPCAPYGYRKIHPAPKVHTLEFIPEEAETVRLIYALSREGKGAQAIAQELNRQSISPRKSLCWEKTSIRKILKNPVYYGFVSWKQNYYPGLHPAIIEGEMQEFIKIKKQQNQYNYYHDILYCKNCGHQMRRRWVRETGKTHVLCRSSKCKGKTTGALMECVDEAVISVMGEAFAEQFRNADAVNKNQLLKSKIARIDYEKSGRGAELKLTIFFKNINV